MNRFQFASASITGRDHVLAGRNNQDSYAFHNSGDAIAGFVADGCGSSPYSEVGAILGCRIAARLLAVVGPKDLETALELMSKSLIEEIRRGAENIMGGSWDKWFAAVRDYYLFTLIGFVITKDTVSFVSFGDGAVILNGKPHEWSYANNAPPFIGYKAIDDNCALDWSILGQLPVEQVENFVIATDGVKELIALPEGATYPGSAKEVPALENLWLDDRNFSNGDQLRRHLALLNKSGMRRVDHEFESYSGLLRDDTTLIVGRQMHSAPDEWTVSDGG